MPNRTIDPQRIRLLREVAQQLARLPLDDVNLLLYEVGAGEIEPEEWYGTIHQDRDEDDHRRLALQCIRGLSTLAVQSLDIAIRQVFTGAETNAMNDGGEPESLELFASHLTAHRKHVHDVANILEHFGIRLFVAHDDIEPDDEWHAGIEAALVRAAGGIVFMHPDYEKSAWCDQEVGWMLGRGIPIRTLMYQQKTPYGPLGKRQAFEVKNGMTADAIAETIVGWARNQPALSSRLTTSVTRALGRSRSYDFAGVLWRQIREVTTMTAGQVANVAAALRDNDQLYGQFRQPGPGLGEKLASVIVSSLVIQPGYSANEDLLHEILERDSALYALLPVTDQYPF